MKKKLLPFILGCSMLAALPIVAHAEDTPEADSGNVTYGDFAEINDTDTGTTDVVTAIPECTMTIPRDTTIRKGALSADIGRVTINGHYFVKPYYVEVSADKQDFTKVYEEGDTLPAGKAVGDRRESDVALANQDIIFDVATSLGTPSASGTAAANENFVQSGAVSYDPSTKRTTQSKTQACRRFWKDMTQTAGSEDTLYKDGEVCSVNGEEHVCLRIASTQWTGVTGSETDTKPVGGQYKGNITFTATFRDNYTDGMDEWTGYPLT